jgi:hypothetical protein
MGPWCLLAAAITRSYVLQKRTVPSQPKGNLPPPSLFPSLVRTRRRVRRRGRRVILRSDHRSDHHVCESGVRLGERVSGGHVSKNCCLVYLSAGYVKAESPPPRSPRALGQAEAHINATALQDPPTSTPLSPLSTAVTPKKATSSSSLRPCRHLPAKGPRPKG